ncbi:MAG: hypothetical protein AB8E82_20515 [Aureispira sp.]
MIKQERPAAPAWLNEKSEHWGQLFQKRKLKNPKAVFKWPTYNGTTINKLLVPILSKMTDEHCSFCDAHPMYKIYPTIEHFKPKSHFPRLVCDWKNLYICCSFCQQKGDKYSKLLLRPDAMDYSFERYFIYDYNKHLLQPNPTASTQDQQRAKTTIELYQLNTTQKQTAREAELAAFEQSNNNIVNDFAYRYLYL